MTDEKYIALYLRISEEDTVMAGSLPMDESTSISSQRILIRSYIQQNPDLKHMQCMEFLDDGYSGTNFERPAIKELLEEVLSGRIACIIVKDISRFGRNYIETGHYIEEVFPCLGTRFIAINDSFDSSHYSGNTPGLEIAFKNVIYDYYSKDLSNKVTSIKRLQQKRGEFVAAKPPYGYIISPADRHKLEVEPESAQTVREIFHMTLDGYTPAQIARSLNEQGIPTPAGRLHQLYGFKTGHRTPEDMANQFWKAQYVLGILQNETVTGATVNNRVRVKGIGSRKLERQKPENFVITPNTHEAIIDKAAFQQAAAIIQLRRTVRTENRQKHENLFYQKIYCGACGCRLKHEVHIRKDRRNTAVYYCPANRIPSEEITCQMKSISDDILKHSVLILIQKQVQLLVDNMLQMPKSNKDDLLNRQREIQRRLEQSKGRTSLLYQDYRGGSISKERFIQSKEAVAAQIKLLEESLELIKEDLQKLDLNKEKSELEQLLEIAQLKSLTQNVVERFIDKLIVDSPASIRIIWKSMNPYTR